MDLLNSMKTVFDQKIADNYDKWYETDWGRYISSLEEELVKEMIGEVQGQKILDVGCGTGNHLKLFKTLGADFYGLDSSFDMLQKAKEKDDLKLILAKGEQLPVMDSVFDTTTLITTLEFCEDPAKVLQEIGRVTKEKVFIGVLNSWSLLAFWRRIKGRFKTSIYSHACFLDIRKLRRMLKDFVTSDSLEWRGVCFLPYSKIRAFRWLDRKLSFRKNPFCVFLGLRITLKSGSSI